MALLLSATSSAPGEYYFALDQNSSTTIIEAPAFTATGTGQPGNDGRFVARGDASGGTPALAFQMRTQGVSALQQWNIGMTDTPAGANSGNNFAIIAYDDGSNPLSVPLAINRATGAVEMSDSLTVGYGTEVLGANLQVNGTAGLSRVYDAIYNRPNAGVEVINTTWGPTGLIITNPVYTPANSGLHSVTMEVTADAAGFAWTNGVACIMGYFSSPFPPFPLISDSFLVCDSLANPTGMNPGSNPIAVNTYKKDLVALVNLTAGTEYAAQINFVGGFNLGTTGGVRFFIQPLLA